jgi:hypothetical protein
MKLLPTGSQANPAGQISGIAAHRFGQSESLAHTSPVLVPVLQQFVPDGQPAAPSAQMPGQSASLVQVAPPIGWHVFFVGVTPVHPVGPGGSMQMVPPSYPHAPGPVLKPKVAR